MYYLGLKIIAVTRLQYVALYLFTLRSDCHRDKQPFGV